MIRLEEAIVKSEVQFAALQEYVRVMAEQACEVHVVEQGVWDRLLQVGQALLAEYLARQGTGDVGETLTLADGQAVPQMGLHTKRYVSVFGPVMIERMCYGRGKMEAVPLDAHLNLPEREYSYLLQRWSQRLVVHDAYGEVVLKVEDLLHLGLSVRTLEQLNREVAQSVPRFQQAQPPPEPSAEGALLVVAVDGKGVPLCRTQPESRPRPHRRTKGEKANKKKMACVGAIYTIAPFGRTPDEVLDEVRRRRVHTTRPRPQPKRVSADLLDGKAGTFAWLAQHVALRNPRGEKPLICLCDGERALWTTQHQYLPDAIKILDLFHVLEKLWLAAHCFHPEGSSQADQFVEHRLRMLLEGRISGVIQGLRQMSTKHHLTGSPKKTLEQVTTYFHRNTTRMRYDRYLAQGYPIGSGVAEGACRHLVKDRLERTGMRWTVPGAQAMLQLRAIALNNDWDPFWDDHIQRQHHLHYGHIAPAPGGHLSKAA